MHINTAIKIYYITCVKLPAKTFNSIQISSVLYNYCP